MLVSESIDACRNDKQTAAVFRLIGVGMDSEQAHLLAFRMNEVFGVRKASGLMIYAAYLLERQVHYSLKRDRPDFIQQGAAEFIEALYERMNNNGKTAQERFEHVKDFMKGVACTLGPMRPPRAYPWKMLAIPQRELVM